MVSQKDLTDIKLELLDLKDSKQLLDFEQQNRDWFEQFIPPRDDNFYSSEGVVSHIQEFLLDYKCRQLLPLLIKNEQSVIIGRLNFTNLDFNKKTAHVGYRVGKLSTSKGVAKRALSRGVSLLASQGIRRLFAYAEVGNRASQKVLTANGFSKVRVVEHYAELHGKPIDCIEFTLLIEM